MFSGIAPCLRIAALDFIPIISINYFCLPAFKSVTHLRLKGIDRYSWGPDDYSTLRGVLMSLCSLAHLELVLDKVHTIDNFPCITLPTLTFLHVDGCVDTLWGVVRNICSFSLTALSLMGPDPQRGRQLAPGTYALTGQKSQFPKLQHITIHHILRSEVEKVLLNMNINVDVVRTVPEVTLVADML